MREREVQKTEKLQICIYHLHTGSKGGSFGTLPCVEKAELGEEGISEPQEPDLGTFSPIPRLSILRSASCCESVVEKVIGLECQKASQHGEYQSLEVEGNSFKCFQSCCKCLELVICKLCPCLGFTPLTFVQRRPAQVGVSSCQ